MQKFLKGKSPQERVGLAKDRLDHITIRLQNTYRLREAHSWWNGPNLREQIPESAAASAYNTTLNAIFRSYLIDLSALWDAASSDKQSIPSVAALLDSENVREYCAVNAKQRYVLLAADTSIPNEVYDNTIVGLGKAVQNCKRVECAAKKVYDFRSREIAHFLGGSTTAGIVLSKTERFPRGLPRHGNEEKLFQISVKLASQLQSLGTGTSFNFDMVESDARHEASQLWGNCQLNISATHKRVR